MRKQERSSERSACKVCTRLTLAYRKSAAGKSVTPGELRPLPVLRHVMDYMLDEVLAPEEEEPENLYAFLWDRIRAIIQDIYVQVPLF